MSKGSNVSQSKLERSVPLKLSDLTLESISFEARYDDGFLFWDKSGHVWDEMKRKLDKLQIRKAEPATTLFTMPNGYQLVAGLDRCYVQVTASDISMPEFVENSDLLLSCVCKHLALRKFSRLGARFIYAKRFESKKDSTGAVLSLNAMKIPVGKHFGIQGNVVGPEYRVRWETEKVGLYIQITDQTQTVNFEPPALIEEIKAIKEDRFRMVYDVDYYTKSVVLLDQLNVKEWINNIHHLIKRDSDVFFQGGLV